MNVVFRRRWTILAILLLTTSSIVYFNVRKPVTYVSSSRILVERGEQGSVFQNIRYLPWAEEVSSQIEVMLSTPVFELAHSIFADSVAARHVTRPVFFQPGTVRADVVGESNVFVIRSSGRDPLESELSCDAVTRAYKQYYEATAAPPQVEDYFVEELQDIAVELEVWRAKKAEFMNRTQFFGSDDDGRISMNKRTHVELRLGELRGDMSQQAIRLESLRRLTLLSPEEVENQLAISEALHVLQSALLQNIKFSLQRTRMERENLTSRYTDRHPEVAAIDDQIRELQVSLKREVLNAFTIEESRWNQLLAKQATLKAELKEIDAHLSMIPDRELELDRIETRIERLKNEHERIRKRQNDAEIALVSAPLFEVTILSPAGPATARKTTDFVRLALGPLLAVIVGLGFAFFLEGLDHSLKNVGEVEQYLGASVLATVSEVREKVS